MEYLYQRGAYWYVRIPNTTSAPLPSSLRYSLKTSSLREARHRSRLIVGSIHTMFRDFQTGGPMAKLTPEKLNAIIREYVTETIQWEEHARATSPRGLNSDTYDDKLLGIEDGIALLRESLAYGEHTKEMAPEAERAVERHQLAPLESYDYRVLCFKLHQAAIKAQEVILKHWQPEGVYNQGADIERALSELGINPPPQAPEVAVPAAATTTMAPPIAPESTSTPLSEVVQNYWDDRSSAWKPRTKTGYQQCMEHLIEGLGANTPVHTIKYPEMKAYRQKLIDSGLSPARVNFYVGFASAVFNHEMRTTGHLPINPAGALKLKETRRRDEMRDGFSLEHLEAMFVKSPEYAQDKLKSPDQFWIPLLSLFSGMRLEEICQLHTDQVAQDDGIWSLIVEEKHKGQSVKTSERRVIPLHPFLIDQLGFHKWAQEQKKGRLWPNLKRINDRWGHYFGRWFGRFWRGCELKGKLGFHSFRHTVETELREANVEGIWIDMLTGHSISGEGGGRYTKRNTKTILERAVMQLKWNEKLDLSGLKDSRWSR